MFCVVTSTRDHKLLCFGSTFTAAIMVHIAINVATPCTVVLLPTRSTDGEIGVLYLTIWMEKWKLFR